VATDGMTAGCCYSCIFTIPPVPHSLPPALFPLSLFLDARGAVKLGDFGASTRIKPDRASGGWQQRRPQRRQRGLLLCGTPNYMPAEMLGADYDAAAAAGGSDAAGASSGLVAADIW
jgi:hypothetical protein